MNELDEIVGVKTVPIEEYVVQEAPLKPLPIPEQTVKNEAAYAAILSGEGGVGRNYQRITEEAKRGESATYNAIVAEQSNVEKQSMQRTLIDVLADPNISLEQKDMAVKNVSQFKTLDPIKMAATRATVASVKGETKEQEEVRLSGAEQFESINAYRVEKQKVLNRNQLSLNPQSVIDFLGILAPFAVNKQGVSTLQPIAELLQINASNGKYAVMPGSMLYDISQTFQKIPDSEKLKVIQKIDEIVQNNSGLVFDNNTVSAAIELRAILDGDYNKFDMVLDNASGVLDMIGLGGTIKGAKEGVKSITRLFSRTPSATETKALRQAAVDGTNQLSPIKTMEATNPDNARNMFGVVVKVDDPEVAKAVAGTTKEDVVASKFFAQVPSPDGSVEAKLLDPERTLRVVEPDRSVVDIVKDRGAIWWSQQEIEAAKANVVTKMIDAVGLSHVSSEMQPIMQGDRITYKALYGSSQGGFLKAEDAVNQAKFAFKDLGVADKDIQLMKKVDDEYVPITLEEARKVDGDYKIAVNFDYQIDPNDLVKMDELSVKRNWFDRFTTFRTRRQGTVANHLFDHASMLDKEITGGAVTSLDQAVRIDKALLKLHSDFSDNFIKLASDRQDIVMDYLKEANYYGRELSPAQLVGKGFTGDEIDVIGKWRKAWDTHFYLENYSLGRSLANQGYGVFENSNIKFFAKPMKTGYKQVGHAYDPLTDSIVKLDEKMIDDLYANGGTLGIMRRSINLDGRDVGHSIIRNTPTEFIRSVNPSDQILNYRPGYYQVMYDAPKFIFEKTPDGKESRAVAVAGDKKEAEHIVKRLAQANGKSPTDYGIRDDRNQMRVDTDAYWDLQSAGGRLAQRHRGKRLETSTTSVAGFDSQYIVNPVEAAKRAARSVSAHVATRDYLEVTKARIMQQYDEFFPTVEGQKKWVSDSNSLISSTSQVNDSRLADARTSVEYINFLENGYINGLDEGFKGLMNVTADYLSKFSTTLERGALEAGKGTPGSFLKSGVFHSYIALNPLRQWLIQSHQSVRLLGYNPEYVLKSLPIDGMKVFEYKNGIRDISKASKADKELFNFINDSGMLDAIDKHNLVRGSISDMADAHNMIVRGVGKSVGLARRVGFDAGESANLMSHMLAVRDKYIKAGKNVNDLRIRDEIYSTARALAYDMNAAGDMPYNQNTFGLFMQFFQVPHKAFLQLTNRRIPVADRMRLFAVDSALWGIPGYLVIEKMLPEDMLPEDGVARDVVTQGGEMILMNKLLSRIAGEDVNIDFSGLSPYGTEGFAKLGEAIATGGLVEFIANSPAYSLYLKEGGKVREAMDRMFKYTGFFDEQEGHDKEDIMSVAKGIAEISSGWSNGYKAYLMWEMSKLQDKSGHLYMEDQSYMYSLAKVFGFSSVQEAMSYKVLREQSDFKKQRSEELDSVYKSYVRVLTRDQQLTINDPQAVVKILGFIKNSYRDDPMAQKYLHDKLVKDMPSIKDKIIKGMIEAGNFPDAKNELRQMRALGRINDKEYENALRMFDDMQKYNFDEEKE